MGIAGDKPRQAGSVILVWLSQVIFAKHRNNILAKPVDEGMTPRSSIFAYLVPAKEEARSKDTRSP
jgi:hypothetical protein